LLDPAYPLLFLLFLSLDFFPGPFLSLILRQLRLHLVLLSLPHSLPLSPSCYYTSTRPHYIHPLNVPSTIASYRLDIVPQRGTAITAATAITRSCCYTCYLVICSTCYCYCYLNISTSSACVLAGATSSTLSPSSSFIVLHLSPKGLGPRRWRAFRSPTQKLPRPAVPSTPWRNFASTRPASIFSTFRLASIVLPPLYLLRRSPPFVTQPAAACLWTLFDYLCLPSYSHTRLTPATISSKQPR
jgi:hypothetical protein